MEEEKVITCGELEMPRFIKEGYSYVGSDHQWHIEDDAPQWAKDEFKKFRESIQTEENGMIIQR